MMALGTLIAFAPMTQAQDKKAERKAAKASAKSKVAAGEKQAAPRDRVKQIAEELQLTAEQKEKLKPIFKEEKEKLQAVRQDAALSREQKRAKTLELREAITAKVKPILTAEQLEKWKKAQAQGQQRRRQQ